RGGLGGWADAAVAAAVPHRPAAVQRLRRIRRNVTTKTQRAQRRKTKKNNPVLSLLRDSLLCALCVFVVKHSYAFRRTLPPPVRRVRPVQPAERDGLPRQLPAQSLRRGALAGAAHPLLQDHLRPHLRRRRLVGVRVPVLPRLLLRPRRADGDAVSRQLL